MLDAVSISFSLKLLNPPVKSISLFERNQWRTLAGLFHRISLYRLLRATQKCTFVFSRKNPSLWKFCFSQFLADRHVNGFSAGPHHCPLLQTGVLTLLVKRNICSSVLHLIAKINYIYTGVICKLGFTKVWQFMRQHVIINNIHICLTLPHAQNAAFITSHPPHFHSQLHDFQQDRPRAAYCWASYPAVSLTNDVIVLMCM